MKSSLEKKETFHPIKAKVFFVHLSAFHHFIENALILLSFDADVDIDFFYYCVMLCR